MSKRQGAVGPPLRARVGAWVCLLALASLVGCASSLGDSAGAGVHSAAALFDEPWQWTDDRGAAVTFRKWSGAPQIVSMFYATCTFRCPMTVAKLKRIESAFARRSLPVHLLLVTLDPRSDTPEKMRAFRNDQGLSGVTWDLLAGSDRDTKALSRLLGVRPSYGDTHIDHDVRVGVVDANGVLVETLDGWHFDDGAVLSAAEAGEAAEASGGKRVDLPASH
jgi:protein SCO1/2